LTRDQRKEAIEGPLGRIEISPSLVQRMLNDAGYEPDQLPILQHALMRTWSHWYRGASRQERKIEIKDYEEVGGFANALDKHANELLVPNQERIAAIIFKRLTAHGTRNRETRDPATVAELWDLSGAKTQEQKDMVIGILNSFRQGEATFLVPREGTLDADTYVDITHESLIRLWRKLRLEWLPAEEKSAKRFLDLIERATRWKTRKGELLAGLDLDEALRWDEQRNKSPAWAKHYAEEKCLDDVLEFIKASRRAKKKRRTLFGLSFIVLGVAILSSLLVFVVKKHSRIAVSNLLA